MSILAILSKGHRKQIQCLNLALDNKTKPLFWNLTIKKFKLLKNIVISVS